MKETVAIPGLGEVRTDLLVGAAAITAAGIYMRHSNLLARLSRESATYQGITLGFILAPQVPGIFASPNPSKMTIATFSHLPDHMSFWIHSGNRESVAQCFLLGIGGALLTGSWWPFIMVMAMAAWKVWSYQQALDGGAESNGRSPHLDMAAGARQDLDGHLQPAGA